MDLPGTYLFRATISLAVLVSTWANFGAVEKSRAQEWETLEEQNAGGWNVVAEVALPALAHRLNVAPSEAPYVLCSATRNFGHTVVSLFPDDQGLSIMMENEYWNLAEDEDSSIYIDTAQTQADITAIGKMLWIGGESTFADLVARGNSLSVRYGDLGLDIPLHGTTAALLWIFSCRARYPLTLPRTSNSETRAPSSSRKITLVSTGSGVAIGPNTVLTAGHVVNDCTMVEIGSSASIYQFSDKITAFTTNQAFQRSGSEWIGYREEWNDSNEQNVTADSNAARRTLAISSDAELRSATKPTTGEQIVYDPIHGWAEPVGLAEVINHTPEGAGLDLFSPFGTAANEAEPVDPPIDIDATMDLAVVSLPSSFPVQARARLGLAHLGEAVYATGYPLPGLVVPGMNITTGVVSSSGAAERRSVFQFTAPIQPGNSGGPVLDSYGRLIGIVVSTLASQSMENAIGVAPQNVNFAVGADAIASFLGQQSIRMLEGWDDVSSATEVASLADQFTYQIGCWKLSD